MRDHSEGVGLDKTIGPDNAVVLDTSLAPEKGMAVVKDRKFVEALHRGLDVLRAFGQKGGVLGNQQIAAITGLPKPTVSRMTYTLMQQGYLAYNPRLEKYELDSGVLTLGYNYVHNLRARQIAKPLMDELSKRTQASVGLMTSERLSMIYVENCRGDVAQSLRMDVGSRLPMATSSAGRAYLAALGKEEREALMAAIQRKSGNDWAKIRDAIELAVTCYEKHGYCLSLGDWDRSVNAVAVPLRLQDGEIMCLNCGGPSYLITPDKVIASFAPQLLHAARELESTGV